MKKPISDFQSDILYKSRLLGRPAKLAEEFLGRTLRLFHKVGDRRHDFAKFDPGTAASRISDISSELETVSRDAEPQFINLGEKLQAVFFDASGISEQISQKVELFGKGSDQSLLVKVRQNVEKSLAELRNFRVKVIGEINHINNIIDNLGQLHRKCDAFEQTTMFIRVVGLNIGIESTRSAESSEMFSVVSGEIKKVSEKITGITKAILDDAKAEQTRQASTSAEISEGMVYLGGLAEDGEQAVRQAVAYIEQIMNISLRTLSDAATHAQEISRQVGEVVQAIQFHDNMSQRIEHIKSAFADVIDLCLQGAKEVGAHDENAQELGKAFTIMDIQQAQLERVISEVELVHHKSREAFEKIKGRVEDLAQTLPCFGSTAGKDKNTSVADPISALKSALGQLQNIQKEGRQLVERIKATTSRASEKAVTLSNHTRLVRRISLETHLMALNAVVKAAHLGDNGRTHEVLAQEMRNLSKRSEMFVENVEVIITQINDTARNLTDDWEGIEENNSDHCAGGKPAMGVVEVASAYESFVEGSAVILQSAEALKEAISRTSKELEFLPALSEELGGHLKAVNETCQILSPWASAYQEATRDKTTTLADRYTMAEERVVHDLTLGMEDEAIELFAEDRQGHDPEEARENSCNLFDSSPSANPGEDDLGDNVELF